MFKLNKGSDLENKFRNKKKKKKEIREWNTEWFFHKFLFILWKMVE